MTHSDPNASRPSPSDSRLAHLSVVWFVPVMGWSGVALAWWAASLQWPWAQSVSTAAAILAASWYVFMLGAQTLRFVRHRSAWLADSRHPVKRNAFAAAPISLILLLSWSIHALALPRDVLVSLFMFASAWQWLTTVFVLRLWLRPGPAGEQPWATINPMLIIPVVGNVLMPLAGLPLGMVAWSWVHLSIGLFFWPVVVALLLARTTLAGGVPSPLQPTWFIQMAPPSLLGAVALLAHGPEVLAWMCWGVAFFVLTLMVSQWRTIATLPFGVPHWGMSFPIMAFTALTWRLTMTPDGGWLLPLAMLLLILGTVLLIWLTLMSWQKKAHLLSAERP